MSSDKVVPLRKEPEVYFNEQSSVLGQSEGYIIFACADGHIYRLNIVNNEMERVRLKRDGK